MALQVVVFGLFVGIGVEVVNGCCGLVEADAEHLGTCWGGAIVYHVCAERLAVHLLYLGIFQQFGWVHQLVALHDVAVVVGVLHKYLLSIEALELVVIVSCCRGLGIFGYILVVYREVELGGSVCHFDDDGRASCDACRNLFQLYRVSSVVGRKELEGTEVLTIERHLERQAERAPGGASLHRADVRCGLDCEWLVSHEVLVVGKSEIINSKMRRFSRNTISLVTILCYQLGEVACLVVAVTNPPKYSFNRCKSATCKFLSRDTKSARDKNGTKPRKNKVKNTLPEISLVEYLCFVCKGTNLSLEKRGEIPISLIHNSFSYHCTPNVVIANGFDLKRLGLRKLGVKFCFALCWTFSKTRTGNRTKDLPPLLSNPWFCECLNDRHLKMLYFK